MRVADPKWPDTAPTGLESPISNLQSLAIVVVGHVDHGKSTLLGRLYADTGSLQEGKLERVQAICRQQGKEFEYAFLFDAFLEEQEQGVTIDTARTFFSWQGRQYVIFDAPGHKEFLKNMVSGAARAEAALLVIDAKEGVQDQSKRHGYLLALLGVRQVAVVVNKMDLVGYRQSVYQGIVEEYKRFLERIAVAPERFVPASARQGDNVAEPSPNMPWYTGPTVLETLGLFRKEAPHDELPLRLPVQDVYKFDERRIIAGRIASGRLKVGDRLAFSPSNKSAAVKTIESFNLDTLPNEVGAGRSIGITLDEQTFIERGEIASHTHAVPLVSTAFRCNVFWLGTRPMRPGRRYLIRLATREVECEVVQIHRVIDTIDLESRPEAKVVGKNEVAELDIRTKAPLAFDCYSDLVTTGRFVLVDGYDVAGGGIVVEALPDEHASLREGARRRELAWVKGQFGAEDRALHYGHRAALVLLVGRNHSTNSRLGATLEGALVADGRHAYLLEDENLRRGLDADLAGADEGEVIRRFGEVARLLLDTGLIVVATTNAFSRVDVEAIRTLVHPVPMLAVALDAGSGAEDLVLDQTGNAEQAAERLTRELSTRGILAYSLGSPPRYRYDTYSI